MTLVLRGGATITTLFGFAVDSIRRHGQTGKYSITERQPGGAHQLAVAPELMLSESHFVHTKLSPSGHHKWP